MAVGMQRFITSLWTASGLYRKVFGELRQYVPPELNANSSTTSPVQEEIEFTERWSCSPTNYWSSAPFPGMLKVISHTPRQKNMKNNTWLDPNTGQSYTDLRPCICEQLNPALLYRCLYSHSKSMRPCRKAVSLSEIKYIPLSSTNSLPLSKSTCRSDPPPIQSAMSCHDPNSEHWGWGSRRWCPAHI